MRSIFGIKKSAKHFPGGFLKTLRTSGRSYSSRKPLPCRARASPEPGMPYKEKFSKVKLVGMTKAVSSNNVSYSFGLLAGVTAPESHGLVKLEHLLNQGRMPYREYF